MHQVPGVFPRNQFVRHTKQVPVTEAASKKDAKIQTREMQIVRNIKCAFLTFKCPYYMLLIQGNPMSLTRAFYSHAIWSYIRLKKCHASYCALYRTFLVRRVLFLNASGCPPYKANVRQICAVRRAIRRICTTVE
jgi:hypothetical protein